MARYLVTAFPYATQYGGIDVPEEIIKKGENSVRKFISDNWNTIGFGEPDLDYAGTDFDISPDE